MTERTQQRNEVSRGRTAHQKWWLCASLKVAFLLVLALTATSCTTDASKEDIRQVTYYEYEVVTVHPHDPHAFTQGLAYHDGFLYEGTGLRGRSELRRIELHTGRVVRSVPLHSKSFGEGITICGNRIVQLTLDSGKGFVYGLDNLQLIDEFAYETTGWGITCNGEHLIMSDGSDMLYFLNPDSYATEHYVAVRDGELPVAGLNELEFIDGSIYANIWPTDLIAIIDPSDGRVTAWIDLDGLLASHLPTAEADVLNGIAYDAAHDRLFVTGKLWPLLFEITLLKR